MSMKNGVDFIEGSGYYRHSFGSILLRATPETQLKGAIIFCKKCHKEVMLKNIENGRIAEQIPSKNIAWLYFA